MMASSGTGATWIAALLLGGCSTSSGRPATPTVDEYVVDCTTVQEDSGIATASDENLAAFINAEAASSVVAEACRSPQLTAPVPGARLDESAPPTFTFDSKGPTCLLERGARARQACVVRAHRPSLLGRAAVAAGATIEGTAHAHCAAFSGENYLLRLTRGGEARPAYSALLSVTSFTPDATIWKNALAGRGGQALALTIERAVFLRGDINDGPYVQPQPPTFVVGP